MSDCAHTALTCANCQADVSHLATRIRTLEAELRDVLDWAVTEKAPLHAGEIASIRAALAHAATVGRSESVQI